MKKLVVILFAFFVNSIFAQETEKRLALVIGNANYDKGELKNPVNDARLIASTLDSLEFEVMLHTNLETRRDMTAAIRDFGVKLPEYDVSFIYYAGHGIQINNENFLLPTKEVFEMEIDVEDYGVSVQRILKYIETGEKEKVNILVIDACRDNPFESNWNATRSLNGGGLAKINPPTGSIIAFSTDSGNTAPDGDGENSIYTNALAKNLLKGGISIEQVFKYVRSDVLSKSNGIQKPIENNTLIGEPYIINKTAVYELEEDFFEIFEEFGYDYEGQQNVLLKLNELSSEIKKYGDGSFIPDLIDLINIFNNELDFNTSYFEFNDIIEKIKTNLKVPLKIKNYLFRLNLKHFLFLNEDNETMDFCSKIEIDCKDYVLSLIDLWRVVRGLDPKQVYGQEDANEWNWFWSNEYYGKIIAKMHNIGEYNLSLSFIEEERNYLYNLQNKEYILEYFKKNPDEKSNNNQSNLDLEIGLVYTLEKIGAAPKKITDTWRGIFKKYPENPNLLIMRAYKILSLYEYELAISLINRIITLEPNDPEPYFLLYYIYNEKKDYSNAMLNINYSIERYDNGFYVSNQILAAGKSFLEEDGYNLLDAPKLQPWELRVYKAELLDEIGNYVLKCEEYRKIIEILQNSNDEENLVKYTEIYNNKCN